MCGPAASTDTNSTTEARHNHSQKQLQEQSSSSAEAAAAQEASGKQEPADHTPIVAPSAESIRQGIMEVRPQTYVPVHPRCVYACFYWAV